MQKYLRSLHLEIKNDTVLRPGSDAGLPLFFLCPDEQQGVKTDNQQRNSKWQMCPLLVKENISEEKDNETGPCGITYGFIYFGIHRS